MPKPKITLKRCVICRRRFRPVPSAVLTQKTCRSPECRTQGRNRTARVRRNRALQDFRVEERERQRERRLLLKAEAPARIALDGIDAGRMSRAGLRAESIDLLEFIQESVDKALDLSRASLTRQLFDLLRDNPAKSGQPSS